MASEDSAQRAADSASSGEDDSDDDKEESEDGEEEEEEEELGEEADNSSDSGTDESEVGRASSSGGSDNEGESESEDEDDDVSDTDQEEEPGGTTEGADEGDAKATAPGITRSVFLKTITAKSGTQPGERTDCKVPSKFPQKPMIELEVNSNIWYQAYVFKESANEVKVRFPGFGRAKTDKIEWLRKSSSRIWTGSYKASDWKHLGKGAWEPRGKAAGSRQQARSGSAPCSLAQVFPVAGYAGTCPDPAAGFPQPLRQQAQSGSAGPGGSAGRGKGRLKRFRDDNTTSMARRKSEHPSGTGLEEEVVSPRPRPNHVAAMRGPADKSAAPLQAQRQMGGSQQRSSQQQQHPRRDEQVERRQQQQQQQPAGDEHHSEGEHYWSAHSPNVAESPGIFADQNSSRSSLDQAGGNNLQIHDPDHDPLRKWFEAHFQKLHAAGKLSSLPFGMCESGVLPDGFILDPSEGVVAASSRCSKAEASHSAAVKPGSGSPVKPAAGSNPATLPSTKGPRGPDSNQHKKKRSREAGGGQRDGSIPDGSKVAGVKRPVKLMVKQVPPQPVVPGPAASVEELPAPGSGLPAAASGFWRDAALGQGQGQPSSPKAKESRDSKGGRQSSQQQQQGQQQQQHGLHQHQHQHQQHQQHGPLQSKPVQACAAGTGPSATGIAGAAAAAAAVVPAVAAAPPVPAAKEVPPLAVGSDDAGVGGHRAPAFALPHKAVSKHPSKDRLGRRVVLSESDDDEDQVSPRPTAAIASAPAAPAATAPTQPASAPAPPSGAAAGKTNAGAASHGSTQPASTSAAVGTSALVREEPGAASKRPPIAFVAASKDNPAAPAPMLTVAVPGASVGPRSQAAEASRSGGAAEQLHTKGAAGSDSGGPRVSESGVAPAEGSRARGPASVGSGLSRPSSPVTGVSGFKLGQQQQGAPSRSNVSEPDRNKAPVLATDDIDF